MFASLIFVLPFLIVSINQTAPIIMTTPNNTFSPKCECCIMGGHCDNALPISGGAMGIYVPNNLVDEFGVLTPEEIKTIKPIDYIIDRLTALNSSTNSDHDPASENSGKLLIIKAKTGAGKTIAIPPEVYLRLNKTILVGVPLQKIATGSPGGVLHFFPQLKKEDVGYMISQSANISNKIDYVTTMILQLKLIEVIKKCEENPNTNPRDVFGYDVIMLDEIHNKNPDTEMTLTIIKRVHALLKHRAPLTILASATFDFADFAPYYGIAPAEMSKYCISVSGSSSSQKMHFLPKPAANWIEAAVETVIKICTDIQPTADPVSDPGDIVIFIPTTSTGEKIQRKVEAWITKKNSPTVAILASSAKINKEGTFEHRIINLTPEERRTAKIKGKLISRLVIIGTDVIETGVTLPSAKYLIECGFRNSVTFHPHIGCEIQLLSPVSRGSAIQRMGRVGRVFEGHVYPLYTEDFFNTKLEYSDKSFIYTSDFSKPALTLLYTNSDMYSLINPPNKEIVAYCFDKLFYLGLIDSNNKITQLGEIATKIPIISVESIVMILAGYIHNIALNDLINMAAAIETLNMETVFGIDDQFISALMLFERMLFPELLATHDHKYGYTELNVNMGAIGEIMKLRGDFIKSFINARISITSNKSEVKSKLFDMDETNPERVDYIRRLKLCIYAGYKYNLLTRDLDSSILTYRNLRGYQVTAPKNIYTAAELNKYKYMGYSEDNYPQHLLCRSMIYRADKGRFILGTNGISVVDGYYSIAASTKLPEFTMNCPAGAINAETSALVEAMSFARLAPRELAPFACDEHCENNYLIVKDANRDKK